MKKIKEIILKLARKNIIYMNDSIFIKWLYEYKIGKKLNLKNPQTFNEKLQWLKLYDRNPMYTKLVDKYEVKKYIEKKIGKEYVIPTLGIYDKFSDINFDDLPNQFVIKCTHDSGGIVICKNKNNFNIKGAEEKINKSLNRNYYYVGREWPYKNVKPRIIVEKYMQDNVNNEIIDYKVMCFNGKPKITFTCTGRFKKDLKVTFFDLNWKKLPFERHYKSSDVEIKKPKNYNQLLKYSEFLSKDIPFVRIDWYEINGHLYFGEFTFYPGNGLEEFNPEKWDNILGSWIKIDQ